MRKISKRLLRLILGTLTKLTLRKHQPIVVCVWGSTQTALSREYAYTVLGKLLPSRRNMEASEAEFSVPLSVLNYPKYPKQSLTWVWVILKTILQLSTNKPYKHGLVLELNPLDQDSFNYWISICRPAYIIQVEPRNFKLHSNNAVVYNVMTDHKEPLLPHQEAARKLGLDLNIDLFEIEEALATTRLPQARIRLLPGKNSSIVIDATYYYFPIKLSTVLELAAKAEAQKVIFTNHKEDQSILDSSWLQNPDNYTPQQGDLIIIRGERNHTQTLLTQFVGNNNK